MRKRGIFIKVFLYTMIFLVVVISVTAALFAQQIVSFYNNTQIQRLNENFSQMRELLSNADVGDIYRIAQEFHESNQSYNFMVQSAGGQVVFLSSNENIEDINRYYTIVMSVREGYTIRVAADTFNTSDYTVLFGRIAIGLAVLLVFSVLAALLFARQMTRPIKRLVTDAVAMSTLSPVSPPAERNDEIGELASIVHDMYGKLKDTIADLEEEKETQRYFFAAASHELKTPIAATTALLQGMFDNIGEYRDHPKYLWECIKMMKEQNKIITEILEIVKLTDGKIILSLTELRLRDIVDDALPISQTLIEKKEQSVDVQIPEEQTCVADYGMLNRVLSNVIMNAVQNTPKHGNIRIWSKQHGEHIRLCIFNAGVRIDEEILPKLFRPFYRVDEARTMSKGRSGLGLTIVAKTLECMGLSFSLENVPDGILFWVDLPVGDER